jgi:hypothetical protein
MPDVQALPHLPSLSNQAMSHMEADKLRVVEKTEVVIIV